MLISFTINILILKKKNYDSEDLNKEIFFDPNQFKIFGQKEQKSNSTEEKTERERCKNYYDLTENIQDNQDNNDFEIIINKRTYDLKNAKKIWMKVTTSKTTKIEAKKLYSKLIQIDIDGLEGKKRNYIRKYKILNILNNIGLIFTTDIYLHYRDVPK